MTVQDGFAGAFAQALARACADRGLTQKQIGGLIAKHQLEGRRPGPDRERDLEKAREQWPRRLSAWKSGDRLPAHENELVLALDMIAPGQSRQSWFALWRKACDARRTARATALVRPFPSGITRGTEPSALPDAAVAVLVGRPPLLADAFQPRTALMERIEPVLDPAAGGGTQILAGDGGTGKTQLAAAAFDHALKLSARLGVWITATSRVSIVSTLARAYLATHPGSSGEGLREAEAFLEWLQAATDPWIIVLDDLRAPGDALGLWPAGAGTTLVTTRRRDAALAGRSTRPVIDVGAFTPRESLDYLTRKLDASRRLSADVLAEAADMAEDLGHLPLALAQASAVIVNDAVTCADYRTRLTDVVHDLGEIFPDDSSDDYEATVATTWSFAVRSADALAPRGLAGALLPLIAVLSPDGIPDETFSTSACRRYLTRHEGEDPASSAAPVTSSADARRALRNLHRLSVLTHLPQGGPHAVRMHALTQRASLQHLSPADLATVVQVGADALVEVWPEAELGDRIASSLRHNAATLLRRFPRPLWAGGAHPLLFRLGDSLGGAGLVEAALTHFQEMVETAEHMLGPTHVHTVSARGHLVIYHDVQGHTDEAHHQATVLFKDACPVLGPDHPDMLACRYLLAHLDGRRRGPAAAIAILRTLVGDMDHVLGPDHLHTLRARSALAYWTGLGGNPRAAADATEALLLDLMRVLGGDHVDTLAQRANLAVWCGEAGDARRAMELSRALLPDRVRLLGTDHPDTLLTRGSIAYWQAHAGDTDQAREAFEELLRTAAPDDVRTLLNRRQVVSWRGHASALVTAAEAYAAMLKSLTAHDLTRLGTPPDRPFWCGLTAPRMVEASTCVRTS